MMRPDIELTRFFLSLCVGGILGICYEFLRPLRPRHTTAADLIFILAAFYGWLYIGFAVCGGDLRVAYFFGMVIGILLLIPPSRRLLAPVFQGFWHCSRVLLTPVKKIFRKMGIFRKIFVASGEKLIKIKESTLSNRQHTTGGDQDDGTEYA